MILINGNHVTETARLLAAMGQTVSAAESCTGGLLSAALTSVPGSSGYFKGSMVVYSNEMKEKFLGIPQTMLREYGAVSPQVAKAMAEGIRFISGSDLGLGITGIAGPGGGSPEKPVGLVYIALAGPDRTQVWRKDFTGDRETIRTKSVEFVLSSLNEYCTKH